MNDVQQRAAAKHFAEYWKCKGYEKGESQKFWLALLGDVFGVEHAGEYISFEDQVHLDHTSFIDGYIPETHVLIEQKGIGKDLKKPIKQSDGTLLKPIEQAKRYANELPYSQRPRWIIVCNFECFHIYDMEHPQADPIELWLKDLPTQYYLLEFLVRKGDITLQQEMEISIQAGEIVGLLYDAFLKEYKDPTNEHSLKSLNALCVRLVFCLYAEDAGIFGKRLMFHDYMQRNGLNKARQALIDLFKVLDTPVEDRDPYMDDELAAFPYVNGGLFSDESIEIPRLNQTIFDLLLNKASAAFDWSEISPTIFGAVFESTLNPETRRSGGMHYTSIENIHKVIDPLFLDALKAELEEIKAIQVQRTQEQRLRAFQDKLASLKFLDPAAGSGNFLTESYLCLRRLENEVIDLLQHGQIVIGAAFNPIKVSIAQFYGIEINDFAVTVAKTALWIAESQMLKRTEDIVHLQLDFLPLKSNVNIVERNALRIDWNDVIPARELSYIMGNPPFVGQTLRTQQQAEDVSLIFGKGSSETKLDYVICWYRKALEYINSYGLSTIKVAFVSTNSICQGESVPTFWKWMFDNGTNILFAYRSFKWISESQGQAAVICVIVGFTNKEIPYTKTIYENGISTKVEFINAYLYPTSNIWITSRVNVAKNGFPKISKGSEPSDGGNLFVSTQERDTLLGKYPKLSPYIRPFVGGKEFLHSKQGQYDRYCLWFDKYIPHEIASIPEIRTRLEAIRTLRENSSADRIQKMATYPYLVTQNRQPKSPYLVIPQHTSSDRKYVPLGFLTPDIIVGNACIIVSNIQMWQFAILHSNVHNAWTRTVCGRLGNGIRYSPSVYNNFVVPQMDDKTKNHLNRTAQAILDARALFPNESLAGLYDDLTMPPELRTAHQQNDRAVWEAYGKAWNIGKESECVAYLMQLYQAITAAEGGKK